MPQLPLRNVGGVEIHGVDVEICQNTNLGLKISSEKRFFGL